MAVGEPSDAGPVPWLPAAGLSQTLLPENNNDRVTGVFAYRGDLTMVELMTFPGEVLPADLKRQVLTCQRVQWPSGFVGQDRERDWIIRPHHHPTHFLLVKDGVLMSHVGVVWKVLQHEGETYTTYGLSGVLTVPAFRRQGHGRTLVDAATEHIRRSEADIGLFMCPPNRRAFYAASGWIPMDQTTLLGGPRSAPYPSGELTMMDFFSEKGKRGRSAFEGQCIYFDDDLW